MSTEKTAALELIKHGRKNVDPWHKSPSENKLSTVSLYCAAVTKYPSLGHVYRREIVSQLWGLRDVHDQGIRFNSPVRVCSLLQISGNPDTVKL